MTATLANLALAGISIGSPAPGSIIPNVLRRTFLAAFGVGAAAPLAAGIPIIDTHIHLFDPNRPQGVPWPGKDNAILYQPALPDRYRKLTGRSAASEFRTPVIACGSINLLSESNMVT